LWGSIGFLFLILIVAYKEISQLISYVGIKTNYSIGILGMFCLLIAPLIEQKSSMSNIFEASQILVSIPLLLLLTIPLFKNDLRESVNGVAYTLLICFYIGFLGSFLIKILLLPYGHIHLSYLMVAVWLRDTGAYFWGSKRKDKFVISSIANPRKTYAGSLAGWIFTLVIIWFFNTIFDRLLPEWHVSFFYIFSLSTLSAFFGQLGDLVESVFKRLAGTLHQLNTLPLEQGVLDKLDGILFAAPIVYMSVLMSSF